MADILAKVDAYYTARLRQHGATPKGVDWNGAESQIVRFHQIAPIIPRDGAPSVLDYGCGYGAFAQFLSSWNPRATYTGYDISPEMIEAANAAHREMTPRFTSSVDELTMHDYVIGSGIFNVRMDVPQDAWECYVFETLSRMAGLAKNGLAFNMLTAYSDTDRMRSDLYYADAHKIFKWCRSYTPWIALLHDYGLYEFTILARQISRVVE